MRWFSIRRRNRSPAARLGLRGERLAERHLRRLGYRILARRWRTPAGEVDLLARHAGQCVVVEVKSGTGCTPSTLAARVDRRKRRRLAEIARYLRRLPRFQAGVVRVDLVTVLFDDGRSRVIVRRNVSCGRKHR